MGRNGMEFPIKFFRDTMVSYVKEAPFFADQIEGGKRRLAQRL